MDLSSAYMRPFGGLFLYTFSAEHHWIYTSINISLVQGNSIFKGEKDQAVLELTFIDHVLRQQVQEHNGYPILNSWFESAVSDLYFVGALAGHTFGPVCRFVSGAKIPVNQIARRRQQLC